MNHLRIEKYQLFPRPLQIYSWGMQPAAVTCGLLTTMILHVRNQRQKLPGIRNHGKGFHSLYRNALAVKKQLEIDSTLGFAEDLPGLSSVFQQLPKNQGSPT